MDLLQNEKCIETEQLNITGNIMTWQGTMVQLKIAKFNSAIHLYSGILFCTSGV